MPPVPSETAGFQPSNDESMSNKLESLRESSAKRVMSDIDLDSDTDKKAIKRECRTTNATVLIPCPLVAHGCLREVAYDELDAHYLSSIHQECIAKAIETQAKKSNTVPECVDLLTDAVSCLHNENIQVQNTAIELNHAVTVFGNQIQSLKSSIEETNQFMSASQTQQSLLQTEMETMKEKINELSTQVCNDGTFIWKITDVAQKISDAIAERQTSIYSPPFYSSSNGYKMCMRLYVNGDGQARRTHLSLFFVLLRGEYDAILDWPFSYKVTFCLFNQQDKRHLIDSFRPDPKSNSFQRPRTGMNIASGIPRFCPLTSIHQANSPYVRDDCMFIRCIIDFGNMAKTMIPYVCSLNPGLPVNVQRSLLQAEAARRNEEIPVTSAEEEISAKKTI
ncbi:unnamed protein product [Adineta ricciae]|nr:unnamed protein product [Adineta ricciae]